MGTSATITMTNLKSATDISDDRLSAHHPNGAGNNTKFGNFLIDEIGNATMGISLSRDGGHTLHPPDPDSGVDGEILNVVVEVFTTTGIGTTDSFWAEQIGIGGQKLIIDQATSSNLSLIERKIIDPTSDDQITMHARFRHVDVGAVEAVLRMKDELNTDVGNYDVQLSTGTITDAVTSSDVPLILDASYNELDSFSLDLTIQPYDPEDSLAGGEQIYWQISQSSQGIPDDSGTIDSSTWPQTVQVDHGYGSNTDAFFNFELQDSGGTAIDSAEWAVTVGDGSGSSGKEFVPWDSTVNG